MGKIKIRDYTCGPIVTIVGLGLYSYYVRELLAVLTLFSVAIRGSGFADAHCPPQLVHQCAGGSLGQACIDERDCIFPPPDRFLGASMI